MNFWSRYQEDVLSAEVCGAPPAQWGQPDVKLMQYGEAIFETDWGASGRVQEKPSQGYPRLGAH